MSSPPHHQQTLRWLPKMHRLKPLVLPMATWACTPVPSRAMVLSPLHSLPAVTVMGPDVCQQTLQLSVHLLLIVHSLFSLYPRHNHMIHNLCSFKALSTVVFPERSELTALQGDPQVWKQRLIHEEKQEVHT